VAESAKTGHSALRRWASLTGAFRPEPVIANSGSPPGGVESLHSNSVTRDSVMDRRTFIGGVARCPPRGAARCARAKDGVRRIGVLMAHARATRISGLLGRIPRGTPEARVAEAATSESTHAGGLSMTRSRGTIREGTRRAAGPTSFLRKTHPPLRQCCNNAYHPIHFCDRCDPVAAASSRA